MMKHIKIFHENDGMGAADGSAHEQHGREQNRRAAAVDVGQRAFLNYTPGVG